MNLTITVKSFTQPKSCGLVISILRDHIQGNTVEKDFHILIELNFINFIYTKVREKIKLKYKLVLETKCEIFFFSQKK